MEAFSGRRVLLLQGPVGPFFANLAKDLGEVGAQVHKINFHAGDWWFYRQNAVWFQGPLSEWRTFLENHLDRWEIDVILLYGDCRPVHRIAHRLAQDRQIDVGAFEEGYLRPNHVTLERNGVNGHSELPRNPNYYKDLPKLPEVKAAQVSNAYWNMVWYGLWYHALGAIGQSFFQHNVHHRALNLIEGFFWIRSVWRKYWYAIHERSVLSRLLRDWNKCYFVVPLQVHNDMQIQVHSPYEQVADFIECVMHSFAEHAPKNTALVIKHHPMDRGYHDYSNMIAVLAQQLGISKRCFYIHDQHLPTLLDHARGAVVINSTVGLQALHHGIPLKVMGEAIYNIDGLTYQGELNQFWISASENAPDAVLLRQFINYLMHTNQINGSFYRALANTRWRSGLVWS